MGLKNDFRMEYGLVVKDVYMRCVIRYADSSQCVYGFTLFYKDGAEKKKMQDLTHKDFVFTPSYASGAPSLLEQCYTHAKSLPVLAGAVDEE